MLAKTDTIKQTSQATNGRKYIVIVSAPNLVDMYVTDVYSFEYKVSGLTVRESFKSIKRSKAKFFAENEIDILHRCLSYYNFRDYEKVRLERIE